MDDIRQLTAQDLQNTLERIRREEAQRLDLERVAMAMEDEGSVPGAVAGRFLEGALERLGYERGFLFVASLTSGNPPGASEPGELRLVASRTRESPGRSDGWGAVTNPEFAVNRSVIKRAVASGRLLSVNDCLIEPAALREQTHRAVLCFPFCLTRSEAGVFYLDRGLGRGEISEAERERLERVCTRLLPIVKAAYLADRLEKAGTVSPASDIEADSEGDDDAVPRAEGEEIPSYRGIVGQDEKLRKIFKIIEKIKDSDLSVCIFGESGTGKELLARAIHDAGRRSEAAFVAENCGAIAETLLESELFGYVKGAFTGADQDHKGLFEQARDGTLFLDEIGDMPHGMQRKLLRVLQEGVVRPVGGKRPVKVNPRVICASNRDLRILVQKGQFRADLFYRLNVITVELPPLRQRPGDISLLIRHAAARVAEEEGVRKRFSDSALRALVQYSWPGNIRELHNVIRKVFLTCPRRVIARKDLAGLFVEEGAAPCSSVNVERDENELILRIPVRDSFNGIIDECERIVLLNSLQQCAWNKSKVTKALRIPRQSLYNKIAKYNLERAWSDGEEDEAR